MHAVRRGLHAAWRRPRGDGTANHRRSLSDDRRSPSQPFALTAGALAPGGARTPVRGHALRARRDDVARSGLAPSRPPARQIAGDHRRGRHARRVGGDPRVRDGPLRGRPPRAGRGDTRAPPVHVLATLRRGLDDAAAPAEAGLRSGRDGADAVLRPPGREDDRPARQALVHRAPDRPDTSTTSRPSWGSAPGSPAATSPPPTSR